MTNSLAIRNLSFALEALSRIGGSYTQLDLFDRVAKLLNTEIKLAEEENNKPITSTSTIITYDENIPF